MMPTKNLLYLGYTGFNNIGDEVCYQAFLQLLAPHSSEISVMPYDLAARPSVQQIHAQTPLAGVVLGGGSLLQGTAFTEPAAQAAALSLPVFLFGTGIDFLDEEYALRLANKGTPVGAPSMFDGKELKEEALYAIIAACRCGGVRGPLTKRFLSRLAGAEKIGILGDPGMVFKPGDDDSLASYYAPFNGGRQLAAVNWGSALGCIFGYDEQRTMLGLTDGLRHLIRRGYGLVIYPLWDGDIAACARLLGAIGRPEACRLISHVPSPDAVCALLKRSALSVGLKLHANVLSACLGTPFISLAYRSKCYDFALSVGMLSQCVSTTSFHIGHFISEREADITANSSHLTDKMALCQNGFWKEYEGFMKCLCATVL